MRQPASSAASGSKRPVKQNPEGSNIALDQLSRQLGITLKELAPLLQISESTLHRFRRQTTIGGPTLERVELLQGIIHHGLRVYSGNEQAFQDWLRYPLGELDGRTPLDCLATIAGFTQVDDILGRIEHGIFF
ncbi:antitoxin Xre/MbcA/ParS toxin-binding domain-containing protein [Larkinella soli]|uniref:antitoxin Xre/MbcA/ParS toxin-binding domain-containing protein n=1 Tax=Larkinella soli TaxID=1770527 RepID=UPI000FFBDFC9|nr:antitoxin Xre/MbcA/ParS toxin-binding domain-containing protein [Larkinella soli]